MSRVGELEECYFLWSGTLTSFLDALLAMRRTCVSIRYSFHRLRVTRLTKYPCCDESLPRLEDFCEFVLISVFSHNYPD